MAWWLTGFCCHVQLEFAAHTITLVTPRWGELLECTLQCIAAIAPAWPAALRVRCCALRAVVVCARQLMLLIMAGEHTGVLFGAPAFGRGERRVSAPECIREDGA